MRSAFLLLFLSSLANTAEIRFEAVDINPKAGITPAVALSDMDGDNDLDLVAMSNSDISWYENPGWARHLICGELDNLNVCMALADITGDGLPEIAAGADWQFENTKSGGSLHILVRGEDVRQPWNQAHILNEPSLHRIRWADLDGDGRQELLVAPLKGRDTTDPEFRETGVRLLHVAPPAAPLTDTWPVEVITQDYHVMHNLIPVRTTGGEDAVLTVSFEGIALVSRDEADWNKRLIHTGSPLPWPRSGASEIKTGTLGNGIPVLATIEPWHGNIVAVYTPSEAGPLEKVKTWTRHVLDESFNQGHALGWADFDGDGRDELVAGYREPSPKTDKVGLYLYQFAPYAPGCKFGLKRQPVDEGGMATEDFAIGDINGDGKPDIFAGGRSTHNLKVYLTGVSSR